VYENRYCGWLRYIGLVWRYARQLGGLGQLWLEKRASRRGIIVAAILDGLLDQHILDRSIFKQNTWHRKCIIGSPGILSISAIDNGCQDEFVEDTSWAALVDFGLGYRSRHGVTRMTSSWSELLKRRLLEVLNMMTNTCACWSCIWIIVILYCVARSTEFGGITSDDTGYNTEIYER
jgi:hypothetical protein